MEENKKTYSEDHVLAMLEELKGQFAVFIEGQKVIADMLDRIHEKLDNKAEKSVADDHEKRIFKLEKTSLVVG
jgi:septum formation inhibitor MinC